MRLVVAGIAFLMVLMPSIAHAAKDIEVDINGGFEDGLGPFPDNWLHADDTRPLRLSMQDDAPEGQSILAYLGGPSRQIRSLAFAFDEGEELVVSAQVRDNGVPVEIGVEFFRHGTSLGQQTLGPRAPSVEWEEVTVHAFSPLGTTRAIVVIKGSPGTLSFLDDVRLDH